LVRLYRAYVGYIGQRGQQPGADVTGSVDRCYLFAFDKGPDFKQLAKQAQALDALGRWKVSIQAVLHQLLHQ
jgi:hypothetical protein